MKFDALTEWQKFEAALCHELEMMPLAEYESAWSSIFAKTQFYENKLLSKVAETLGLEFRTEFLRCDYTLSNSDHVPVVFIESENAHESASQEVDKLCAVGSPVRVLILSCAWADGERAKWLPSWKEKMATHHKFYEQNAVYMIVVGEWGRGKPDDDKILRYYIESFDVSGQEIGRKELVLS